jgi:glutathione S-transferase
LLLGFKGLAWDSVTIPAVMPKPDLVALTGGYRRTPILQCGADIYCDSALIARRLEREVAEPALFPAGREAAAAAIAQFADQVLFQHGIALNFQPASIAARLAGAPPEFVQTFVADRKALFTGGTFNRLDLSVALSQWPTLLGRLEAQLTHGPAFLLGEQPCIADISTYHPLWFVANNANVAATLDPFPQVRSWMARIKEIGHGQPQTIDSAAAVEIARAGVPEVRTENDFVDPNGFMTGQSVSVSAVDYGVDPVTGMLVWQDAEEIVVRREDERVGIVHVHFPRIGYRTISA